MNENLTPSDLLIEKAKLLEGFIAVAHHQSFDPPGVITGGYGETHCYVGQLFSKAGAEILLRKRMKGFGDQVIVQVKVPLVQGQYDALTDLAYNVGAHGFPTLITYLNAGNIPAVIEEFEKHVYANHVKLSGLVNRRHLEETWFLKGEVVAA